MTSTSKAKKDSTNAVVGYFQGAWQEFGKVTWPTKEQAALLTAVSIVVSGLIALLIGLADLGLSQIYQLLLDLFS